MDEPEEKGFDQTGSDEERGKKTGEGEIEGNKTSQEEAGNDKTCEESDIEGFKDAIMSSAISVTLEPAFIEPDEPAFALKIQSPDWELNVLMREVELALIPGVRSAQWNERGSIRIGKSTNSQVFWSCEDGNLSIFIGHDDETWDFGVTVPEAILDDIIAEIGHRGG